MSGLCWFGEPCSKALSPLSLFVNLLEMSCLLFVLIQHLYMQTLKKAFYKCWLLLVLAWQQPTKWDKNPQTGDENCKLNSFSFTDVWDRPSAGSAIFHTSHNVLKSHFTNFLDVCHIFLQLLRGKYKSYGFWFKVYEESQWINESKSTLCLNSR